MNIEHTLQNLIYIERKVHVTSDAQFWHVPIIGTIKSMCTLFNSRDIKGTNPFFLIASLFGFDSESE